MSSLAEQMFLNPQHPIEPGQPAWDVALLFPAQGEWTETEYLSLDTNRLVELADGFLEVLPFPTPFIQRIVQHLLTLLDRHVTARELGEVLMAPLPVRLWSGTMREPDVLFFRPGRIRDRRKPPEGADLVMEIVGEGEENRKRDLVTKRDEYFRAGIQEYWIVDPREKRITVLVPDENGYKVHGEFTADTVATSLLLPGFSVEVSAAFAAGAGPVASA